MISSVTRKKAWSSSVSHPKVAKWVYSTSSRGRERRMEAVSSTERPRFSLPLAVLCFKDCRSCQHLPGSFQVLPFVKLQYILKPLQGVCWQLGRGDLLREIFDQGWEESFEIFATGFLCHCIPLYIFGLLNCLYRWRLPNLHMMWGSGAVGLGTVPWVLSAGRSGHPEHLRYLTT